MVYQKLHVVLDTLLKPFPLSCSWREWQRPNGLCVALCSLFPRSTWCIWIVLDNDIQEGLVVVD